MEETLINVEGLSKKFCRSLKKSMWYGMQDIGSELLGKPHGKKGVLRKDEFWALNDISFELKRGECMGLIGHNGAGKSTMLKILNGLIKPDKGQVTIRGRIGALIELGAGFNPILTGRENIYVNASVLGFTRHEIDEKFDSIVEFSEIAEFLDTPVQNYSSGMKVRLGFSIAAQMEPDVLLVDEVLAVGDIGFRVKCLNRIHELLESSALIFVSHSMPQISRICTKAIVMRKGVSICSSLEVSEAIDTYHSEFSIGERTVVGSGDVEVENVTINGLPEDMEPVIPFGRGLQLGLTIYTNTHHKILQIRLAIWNQDQRPVADVLDENYQQFSYECIAVSDTFLVEIPALHLASGKYAISIVVFDHESTRLLCRIDNAVSFIMGQHIPSFCESFIAARWSD